MTKIDENPLINYFKKKYHEQEQTKIYECRICDKYLNHFDQKILNLKSEGNFLCNFLYKCEDHPREIYSSNYKISYDELNKFVKDGIKVIGEMTKYLMKADKWFELLKESFTTMADDLNQSATDMPDSDT